MIRLILSAGFIGIFLILSLPVQLVLWLMWKAGLKDATEIASLKIVQFALKTVHLTAGIKVKSYGEENVPKDQPVLYVGNHNSYFDIVVTYARVPRRTGYVAKKELNRIPGLRIWMKYLHCLFLDRNDLKAGLKMIFDAIELINNGISVCIFPEGTRNDSGDELNMLPFKEGSLKIAEKSGCLIIPVAMSGTADIFEKHVPYVRSSKVQISYGKPIDPKTLDKEEKKKLASYVQSQILELLKEQKNISTES